MVAGAHSAKDKSKADYEYERYGVALESHKLVWWQALGYLDSTPARRFNRLANRFQWCPK